MVMQQTCRCWLANSYLEFVRFTLKIHSRTRLLFDLSFRRYYYVDIVKHSRPREHQLSYSVMSSARSDNAIHSPRSWIDYDRP